MNVAIAAASPKMVASGSIISAWRKFFANLIFSQLQVAKASPRLFATTGIKVDRKTFSWQINIDDRESISGGTVVAFAINQQFWKLNIQRDFPFPFREVGDE